MRTKVVILMVVVLAVAAAPSLIAQSKPNFSGECKLNIEKSDFGPMPPPSSRTDKIDHKEPGLKVPFAQVTEQGDMNGDFNYTTDGKECTNEMGEAKQTLIMEKK